MHAVQPYYVYLYTRINMKLKPCTLIIVHCLQISIRLQIYRAPRMNRVQNLGRIVLQSEI